MMGHCPECGTTAPDESTAAIQALTNERDQLRTIVAYLLARMPECDRCAGLQPTIECYCIKVGGKTAAARYLAADRFAVAYDDDDCASLSTLKAFDALDEWRRLGGGE